MEQLNLIIDICLGLVAFIAVIAAGIMFYDAFGD